MTVQAIIRYAITDSTNSRAKQYISDRSTALPALFIAREQSAGRGRMGRSFYSPANTGLYATLLFRAPSAQERLLSLTSLAAVALSDAISELIGVEVGIKWVNDLYLDGRKVAGILAESFGDGDERYIALGFGVNLSTSSFPEDIIGKAGALFEGKATEALAEELALSCSQKLLSFISLNDISSVMEEYRARSIVIGKKISFIKDGTALLGTAVGVSELGALCVSLDGGGEVTLSTGEISIFLQ